MTCRAKLCGNCENLTPEENEMLSLSNYHTFTTDHQVIINYFQEKVVGITLIDPYDGKPNFIDSENIISRARENSKAWNRQSEFDLFLPIMYQDVSDIPNFLETNFNKVE